MGMTENYETKKETDHSNNNLINERNNNEFADSV